MAIIPLTIEQRYQLEKGRASRPVYRDDELMWEIDRALMYVAYHRLVADINHMRNACEAHDMRHCPVCHAPDEEREEDLTRANRDQLWAVQ